MDSKKESKVLKKIFELDENLKILYRRRLHWLHKQVDLFVMQYSHMHITSECSSFWATSVNLTCQFFFHLDFILTFILLATSWTFCRKSEWDDVKMPLVREGGLSFRLHIMWEGYEAAFIPFSQACSHPLSSGYFKYWEHDNLKFHWLKKKEKTRIITPTNQPTNQRTNSTPKHTLLKTATFCQNSANWKPCDWSAG